MAVYFSSTFLSFSSAKSLGLEFMPYTLLVYSFGIALGFLETLLKVYMHADTTHCLLYFYGGGAYNLDLPFAAQKASSPEEGGDDADAFSSKHWENRTTPVLSLFRCEHYDFSTFQPPPHTYPASTIKSISFGHCIVL